MKIDTKVNVTRLIAEIYKRPALWNQKHPQYLNRDVTTQDWADLSTLLKAPKPVLKTKWKGLRDTFRTELKKELVYYRSKSPKNHPRWRHYVNLQFLRDQMMPKPPIWEGPIIVHQSPNDPDDFPLEMQQLPKLSSVKKSPEKRGRAIRTSSKGERKRCNGRNVSKSDETNGSPIIVTVKSEEGEDTLHFGEHLDNSEDNVSAFVARNMSPLQIFTPEINEDNSGESVENPIEVKDHFDDNYHFFMSLLPHFNKLSDERRMLLRMQIQEMVYKEVYKNFN